jgi:uncharacterized protein YciI
VSPPGSRLGNNAATEFDRFTIALRIRRDDAPELDEGAENALQDAHMAHLTELHQAGHLLAAGPLLGEPGRAFRGLSILAADPDQARVLKEQDPCPGRHAPGGVLAMADPGRSGHVRPDPVPRVHGRSAGD